MPTESLQIETVVLGPLQTNCYALWAGKDCWVVDVGIWPKALVALLDENGLTPSRALVTHGHADHIAGLVELKARFPAMRIACPAGDAAMLTSGELNLSEAFGASMVAPPADDLLDVGQTLMLGEFAWQVLDTSGHTPGGVSYYCAQAKVVLSGDALFAGNIGRTDIPGGSDWRLLRNIRKNLITLPDETRVLCGHGPATTIGHERKYNQFLSTIWTDE